MILLLLACGGPAPPFPGAETPAPGVPMDCDADWRYRDRDGDGWGDGGVRRFVCVDTPGWREDGGDCDDTRRDVYPDAEEHCDGVDHDCDGLVNEDDSIEARDWYPDEDGDGEGADGERAVARSCEAPPGSVGNERDCDDADPLVNTRGAEVCDPDGVDEDCDGRVNDEDSGVSGTLSYWIDRDGDGYGSAVAGPRWACELPFGGALNDEDCDDSDPTVPTLLYADEDRDGWGGAEEGLGCPEALDTTSVPGDCDDQHPGVNPGVRETDCTSLVDVNCDGVVGAEDPDGDGAPNCEDCGEGDPGVHEGAEERCDGVDQDCDGEVDEDAVDTTLWYRDWDQDGYGGAVNPALACSAPVGYSGLGGDCDDTDLRRHPGAEERCGMTDYDCDGVTDEDDAVGCVDYHVDADLDGYGALGDGDRCSCRELEEGYSTSDDDCDDADPTVHPGWEDPRGGGDENCDRSELWVEGLGAPTWSDAFGARLAMSVASLGDIDADGVDDLAVRHWDGAAWSVLGWSGAEHGELGSDRALFVVEEPRGSGDFGLQLRGGVDLDGDGLTELVVSDPTRVDGERGATVYLHSLAELGPGVGAGARAIWAEGSESHLGTAVAAGADGGASLLAIGDPVGDGVVWLLDGVPRASGRVERGAVAIRASGRRDVVGGVVGEPRDLDGDGVLDLVVGVPDDGPSGAFVVFRGPIDGDREVDDFDSAMAGSRDAQSFPTAVSTAPDWDGDGLAEIVATMVGEVIVTGLPEPDADLGDVPTHAYTQNAACRPLAHLGADLDGDGAADLVIGDPYLSMSVTNEGGVWFLPGPAVGYRSISSARGALVLEQEDGAFPNAFSGSVSGDSVLGGAPWQQEGGAWAWGLWRLDEESWR